jgi:arylsulfatase A-like enzyme
MDTHFPYMAPDSEISPARQLYLNYRMTRNRIADVSITPQEQRSLLNLYREEIEYLDYELGELIDELDAREELSDTLIVFTADHGELLGEYGQFAHKSARLGTPLTHVPLILWCQDFPSKKVHTPVSLVDIVPTIYDYLDIPSPDGLDGHSLRPVIENDARPVTPAISEMGHDPMNFGGPPSKDTTVVSVETDEGIRVGDWLRNDPPSENLDEYELLRQRREALDAKDDTYSVDSDMNSETKSRLQDLGYLE